jgi:hypothetical protein
VVVIKGKKSLWQKSADSLLDFGCLGMHEPSAEGVARGLELFGRLAVAELVQETTHAQNRHKKKERSSKWTERFNKERLHAEMIQDVECPARGWPACSGRPLGPSCVPRASLINKNRNNDVSVFPNDQEQIISL